MILRGITVRSFHQLGAPELPSRLAADDSIAGPEVRTEDRSAIDAFVENHADGGLMLRAIFHHGGPVHYVRQVDRMARGEAVVFAPLDVEEFVKGVAVWQPRRPFLLGREEIALAVESEGAGKADARADSFAGFKIGGNLLDRAALTFQVVASLPGDGVDEITIRVVGTTEAEIEAAVLGIHRHAHGVHALRDLLPAGGDDDFLIGATVAILVEDQRNLAFAGHKNAFATRVILA